jgi:hypothetical protein
MNTNLNKTNRRLNSRSTNKVSVRLPEWQRDIVNYCSLEESASLTDTIKNSINHYFLSLKKPNKCELKQKSREKYIQLDLFEWAEKNNIQTIKGI